jgi:CRISPR-associated endonuclease Csy4
MNFYLDININPHLDIHSNKAMGFLFQNVHKSIVALGIGKIAISFPKAGQYSVGSILRLHGSEHDLSLFVTNDFLIRIKPYSFLSNVKAIPNEVLFKKISRIRSNMSKSKLNRLLRRGTITADKISGYMDKMLKNSLNNSYIDLYSESTNRTFRMFFQFSEILSNPSEGEFDSYGLSDEATIPWF